MWFSAPIGLEWSCRQPEQCPSFTTTGTLWVTIVEDLGHFPRAMVIGGIKQTVYEAVELHNIGRANAEHLKPFATAEGSTNA